METLALNQPASEFRGKNAYKWCQKYYNKKLYNGKNLPKAHFVPLNVFKSKMEVGNK